ncbi:MAG: DNA polymerase III subunit delta [Gammaproteobacteria bacterium]|nr:DNA polymerase III subunit delta [Gammaproteobacteria bacterium]
MKIKPEKLAESLKLEKLPIYWISGDEHLLVQESADLVRTHFKNIDFMEREVFNVDRDFKWDHFIHAINNLSLFSEKKVFDLRIHSAKLNQDGKDAIETFRDRNSPDLVLLIRSPKLESAHLNSKWLKTHLPYIALVQIWPVNRKDIKNWLSQRLIKEGINADRDALQLLSDKIEGNLLAAVQEIEKLKLLSNTQGKPITLNARTTMQVIADNSRYNVYNLVDSALLGESARCLKILTSLKGEGIYPLIILGAITRELRSLLHLMEQKEQGKSINAIIQSNRVWFNRKEPIAAALKRCNTKDSWKMLSRARKIDQALKGMSSANPWDEISSLILELSGQNIPNLAYVN